MKKFISCFLVMLICTLPLINSYAYENTTTNALKYDNVISQIDVNSVKSYEVGDAIYYDDVYINGVRVCAGITNDIFEYAYQKNGYVYSYTYKNDKLVEFTKDPIVFSNTYQAPENDMKVVREYLAEMNETKAAGSTQIITVNGRQYLFEKYADGNWVAGPAPSSGLLRSVPTINVGLKGLMNKYPTQNKVLSNSYRFLCTPLNVYKAVMVRDTRNNYSYSRTTDVYLSIGKTVTTIAATLLMTTADVISVFGAFLTAATEAATLICDVNAVSAINATASRLRQGYIDDTTYAMRAISAYTEAGTDSITYTNQIGRYDWGIDYQSMTDRYPDSYITANASSAYNSTLTTYGYWPWGDL